MGSIGNSTSTTQIKPATTYNEYGFEVSNNPDIEFGDRTWEQMAELRKYQNAFEDRDLADDVDEKISELVNQYGDLERYDPDLTTIREKLEGENVTSDEYWAGYHVMANILNIKPQRFTVLDSSMSAWDNRFTSAEQAEQWAAEREDAKYVYDKWTQKYRKIGGKNWRA